MESNSKIKNVTLQNNAFRLHFVSCVFVEIGNWKMTLKRIYYAEDLSKSCSNELPVYKMNDDQYSSQRKNDENVFGWSSLKKCFKIIIKIARIF